MTLISNVTKIVSKTNRTSRNTSLSFSNIFFFRKDKRNTEKIGAGTNSHQKNFSKQKNIKLLSNDYIKK